MTASRTSSTGPAGALGCPQCGGTESLATIEKLTGISACQISRAADGSLELVYSGGTEVLWDGSFTVGVCCASCGFEHVGADWETVLGS